MPGRQQLRLAIQQFEDKVVVDKVAEGMATADMRDLKGMVAMGMAAKGMAIEDTVIDTTLVVLNKFVNRVGAGLQPFRGEEEEAGFLQVKEEVVQLDLLCFPLHSAHTNSCCLDP